MTIYGASGLLEYGTNLVLAPRLCDWCIGHVAVYYDCSIWPASYLCRVCIDAGRLRERELAPLTWKSPRLNQGLPSRLDSR